MVRKANGNAQFSRRRGVPRHARGVQMKRPPPLFGATVKSFDAAAAGAVHGVVKGAAFAASCAVVAKSFGAKGKPRRAHV